MWQPDLLKEGCETFLDWRMANLYQYHKIEGVYPKERSKPTELLIIRTYQSISVLAPHLAPNPMKYLEGKKWQQKNNTNID